MLVATSTMNPTVMIVLYVVIFGGIFYFMGYRPQKKEKKRVEEMMASLAIGDSVLTTSGFYGYGDKILLVGINYNEDPKNKKKHTCIIESVHL